MLDAATAYAATSSVTTLTRKLRQAEAVEIAVASRPRA